MAPLPAYQRVKRHILKHIEAGDWQPGDRVPSENELVRLFAISRMTVNRAVRELTRDGRLIRLQGKGTYVAEPKAGAALLEILPIDEEIAARGAHYRADVITLAREPVPEDVARLSQGPRNCNVVFTRSYLEAATRMPRVTTSTPCCRRHSSRAARDHMCGTSMGTNSSNTAWDAVP